jgi:hypothetical protein
MAASRPTIRTDADRRGIVVTVTGQNQIARHRPTRYALMMRRQRANAARMAQRLPQLPAVLPGDCVPCGGLGVRGEGRERCPACNGSGER